MMSEIFGLYAALMIVDYVTNVDGDEANAHFAYAVHCSLPSADR